MPAIARNVARRNRRCGAITLGRTVYRDLSPSNARTPYPDNLLVRVGRRTLRLPGRRLTFLQLIITALDVAAAATVLYLLLPEAPPFGPFLLVYLLALAAGVLSHVPGGVGVFEAILLAAFADTLGAAPLAAACCCTA
jgi:phosphatidylglycerol lysyltransferase